MIAKNKKTEGGYTLLFAVITATLVLGVAVFILSVSKKQYALSVAGRDSMYAIYAADSGMECAIVANLSTTTSPAQISCNGASSSHPTQAFIFYNSPDSTLWPNPVGGGIYQIEGMVIALPGGTCAKVSIYDGDYEPVSGTIVHKTIIESRGYNYCNASGPVPSSRTVERALRITYQ